MPEKTVKVELNQRQLSALLTGALVANSLALGEELPDFYKYDDRRYEFFNEAVEKLHTALGELTGVPV